MDIQTRYKSLFDDMIDSYAKAAGIPRKLLRAHMTSADFSSKLSRLNPDSRTRSTDILSLCLPVMRSFCEVPEEGWLRFIYSLLCEKLYPSEQPVMPTKEQKQAVLFFLSVFSWFIRQEKEGCPFDPLTDVYSLTKEEAEQSRVFSQYTLFQEKIRAAFFPELLRLGRDIQSFDPASHTIGVHHLAVHTAREAKQAGLPVDVALVSAAALSHDIGKFGCRGADMQRIPYLHYYYTWKWLTDNGMPDIAHIAANHSTWDLEFENLPIESLLLIYADFRVRGEKDQDGIEHVRIYSLQDAYDIIFSKMANMTAEKQKRYLSAYLKLRDFERHLISCGVNPDPLCSATLPLKRKDAALLSDEETLAALTNMIQQNNIRLMHRITISSSFEPLLEQARAEKNLQRIRSYLDLFEEYSTYMTREHKLLTLHLLYELLMHHEGDVRRQAGRIMGAILCNSGPRYRKELPESAPDSAIAPTLHALLRESTGLWESYVQACLHPDHKISAKHAARISNSLKTIADSLFSCCEEGERRRYWEVLFHAIQKSHSEERLILMDALQHIPVSCIEADEMRLILSQLAQMLCGDEIETICALRTLLSLLSFGTPIQSEAVSICEALTKPLSSAAAFLRNRVRVAAGAYELPMPEVSISEIYLSDLKSSVHWTVKLAYIDYLRVYVRTHPEDAFHIATHFSNLISVSEHLPVREQAGKALTEIAVFMSDDQNNEIVVDLLRELETGQNEIVFYIPPYVGALICRLPEKERDEAISFLEDLLRASQPRSARAALSTLGVIVRVYARSESGLDSKESKALIRRIFGLLFTGVAHYDERIHLTALSVLCRDVFTDDTLSLAFRKSCFTYTLKKLFTLLEENRDDQIVFFNRAAMLNHLYRFLTSCIVELGDLSFPAPLPVAFFPGTFDPFSAGHKRIVEEIRAQGFEVYLAVDEFSWSKRTLPKLLRRQIVSMSVADQCNVFLFPDDTPINIAVADDLAKLRALFAGREFYLVAGSDVIENASAYASMIHGSAAYYDHIVFSRIDAVHGKLTHRRAQDIIKGKLILLSLPAYYEAASSTQIRDNIDKDMDITMLVDPVVQEFIYSRGLYLRSPQYKSEVPSRATQLHFYKDEACSAILPSLQADAARCLRALITKSYDHIYAATLLQNGGDSCGCIAGYSIGVAELYGILHDMEAAEFVRLHASGRILVIESLELPEQDNEDALLSLLTELLARSLSDDHSYALYHAQGVQDAYFRSLLPQLGFQSVQDQDDLLFVDMRTPLVLIQDAFQRIKAPLCDNREIQSVIRAMRPRLRDTLCSLFPGKLLLSFDAELLKDALLRKVQSCNGVLDIPAGERGNGKYMCVPYGKILSGELVPHTVTKTLHADKVFHEDVLGFDITEFPGYSPLRVQVRTLKSFRRPILLIDDLLHNGYRLEKLDPLFKEEDVTIDRIIVGILSGRGKDLMQMQGRSVECEYFIPNLHYWFTESLLYPFLGGDSAACRKIGAQILPSINLLLPYVYPKYLHGVPDSKLRSFSNVCLENAHSILSTLEAQYQSTFHTALSLKRLGEALYYPRFPDKGAYIEYDMHMPPSLYVENDLAQNKRISREEDE